MRRRDVMLTGAALALQGCASVGVSSSRPIVIAHRGASGERPEHTMAAYNLAIAQGADFIEPDLVMTADGVLVCRHENDITGTTDVAERPEFAALRRDKNVDGAAVSGWFVEDFTLEQLKTLRCKERLPQLRPQNTAYDGQEEIPTFAEVLALAREAGVGIYPELKHPTYLRERGLDPVPAFVEAVRVGGGQRAADAMYVQCFEVSPLVQLGALGSLRFQCIQLIAAEDGPWDQRPRAYADMLTDAGLAQIATYARGIGVEKSLVIPRDAQGRSLPATNLCERAYRLRLGVHAWTFRAENVFLPLELRSGEEMAAHGDLAAELRAFFAAGVTGVFSDYPAAAVAAR